MNYHEKEKQRGIVPLETEEGQKALIEKVRSIVSKGNDVEIRGKIDGVAVYEISKRAV